MLDGFDEGRALPRTDGGSCDAERFEEFVNEMLRAAIEGHGVDDPVAGTGEGEDRGHDRRQM